MKKLTFVLVILCILCQGVFAASYVETSNGAIPQGPATFSAKIDPSVMAVSDMGFTQNQPDLNGTITKLDRIEITEYVADTETFRSQPFYIYWNILGGATSIPTINLTINKALKPFEGNHSVDWKVSWTEGNEQKSVDSKTNKSVQIFAPDKVTGNVLERVSAYKELVIETTERFWEAPIDKYEAQLWIEVVTG